MKSVNRAGRSRSRKERILAVGYYGWGNFGDELFREVIHSNAQEIWKRPVVVRDFVFPAMRLRRQPNFVGALIRVSEAILGGLWAHRIVFFGGSVFSRISGAVALRLRLFRRHRVFEAIGVSIGPFVDDADRAEVHDALTVMSRIVVRDTASLAHASLDAELAGDLAALRDMPQISEEQRSGLTICPSAASNMSAEEFTELLVALLPSPLEHQVTLLALNVGTVGSDVPLCGAIANLLRTRGIRSEVREFESVQQVIEQIAYSKAVWSQRLHGVITAYLCNVPMLAFSHHSKLADFAADIGLDSSALLASTMVQPANLEAAFSSLKGEVAWTLEPATYVRQTKIALGL